ncbi:MAG TPA: MBL fold metallo-hydrolase [Solirubrobacterales bacterium]
MATMTFQFLDVGQGDSTLVQICEDGEDFGELVLVDCGEKNSPMDVAGNDALAYLIGAIDKNSRERGDMVPRVDMLFITHPDEDHFNKLAELIQGPYPSFDDEKLSFDAVYYGGKPGNYPAGFIAGLPCAGGAKKLDSTQHAKIDAAGVVTPDWEFAGGEVDVYLLSANFPSRAAAKKNPKSIVLMFDLDGSKVTLQGDAEGSVESHILRTFEDAEDGFLNAIAMKLGHHGSRASTSDAWLEQLEPRAIFASGDMHWAHPYCEPICRALDKVPDWDDPGVPVWYCCGEGGIADRQYYNNPTDKAICLNLWYVVEDDTEDLLEGSDVKGWVPVTVAKGTTYGVQWTLEVSADGVVYNVSRRAVPAPGQMVSPPFDCDEAREVGCAGCLGPASAV